MEGYTNGDLLGSVDGVVEILQNGYSNLQEVEIVGERIANLKQEPKSTVTEILAEYPSDSKPCQFPILNDGMPCPKFEEESRSKSITAALLDVNSLSQLCGKDGITMASVLQLAWALVLQSYTGDAEVCFGYVTDAQYIMGPPDDGLLCRVKIEKSAKIIALLRDLQSHCIQVSYLQDSLKPAENNLFNTIVNVQTITSITESLLPTVIEHNWNPFDIVVNFTTSGNEIGIHLDYSTSRLSGQQASNVTSTLSTVLKSIIQNSLEQTVGDVHRLSDIHLIQISSWNANIPKTVKACVHKLVEEQAKQQPDAQAIHSAELSMTYRQLDEASQRLAQFLISKGVGPEVIVPFCFDKSVWAVVAMLAILKAGGVCTALDPSQPLARLQGIVSDVEARIVVTQTHHVSLCSSLAEDINVVTPDMATASKLPDFMDVRARMAQVQPNNAAFVAFTSGSTGRPKGAVIEHVSIATSSRYHGLATKIGKHSRVLQFAAYTWDVSVQEIFTTLIHGGCVCVPSEYDRLNDVANAIRSLDVNWAKLTPTVSRLIDPKEVPKLKTLVVGGEPLSQDIINNWSDKVESLIVTYGPAECSIVSASAIVNPTEQPRLIGHATGCLLWVVDVQDHNTLAPIGSIGELLIDGVTLARRYIKNDAKNAEAFIQPTWTRDGQGNTRRLYKTGDLVRYRSDGKLVYIGRKDTQVKIHGQRVELGEIESHLLDQVSVRHVVTLVPSSGSYKTKLVAVLSLSELVEEASPQKSMELIDQMHRTLGQQRIHELRNILENKVPNYMIPVIWVIVKSIPRLSSGKLDRNSTAQWIHSIDEKSRDQIASLATKLESITKPETLMEAQLQKIWSRVLNRGMIGLDQPFITIGGDSISAMQVVSSCRSEGIILSVQDILRWKTIAKIAPFAALSNGSIESQEAQQQEDLLDQPFTLSPIQQLHFALAPPEGADHYNQSFLVRVAKRVQENELRTAIEHIVEHHSMLRARFQHAKKHGEERGDWTQIITSDIQKSYRLRVYASNNITNDFTTTQASLDIQHGPVFAVDLATSPDHDNQLLYLVAHHLVIDLVSWRIVLQDLEDLLNGKALPSRKPFSFQRWVKAQVEYSHRNHLPHNVLPFRVKPANLEFWGMQGQSNTYDDVLTTEFTINTINTSQLLGSANSAMRTEPVELMVAAVLHSFHQVFKDETPTVFCEGHGREPWSSEIDLSRTVGWFTTMFPISIKLQEGRGFSEAVRLVKDTRRSIPANGWPYFTAQFHDTKGYCPEVLEPKEILFNYLGLYQQLDRTDTALQKAPVSFRSPLPLDMDGGVERYALFDIAVSIDNGQMSFQWRCNRKSRYQEHILTWKEGCKAVLEEAAKVLSLMTVEATISDFPLMKLSPESFRTLCNRVPALQNDPEQVEDIFPCSPMQEGILFSRAKAPGTYDVVQFYKVNTKSTIPLPSPTAIIDALKVAWQKVVDYHPVLRTMFIEGVAPESAFDQVVFKHIDAAIIVVDCTDEKDFRTTRKITFQQESALGSSQAHQLTLGKASNGSIFCKLEYNHAIGDATSAGLLMRDFRRAYDDCLGLGTGPLYSNFISYIQGMNSASAVQFWREYLEDVKPCRFPVLDDGGIELMSRSNSRLQSIDIDVDFETRSKLIETCSREGVTMANLFQLAWALVLQSYTGGEDVCFGYLASGRDAPIPGVLDAVGPFINMLICRLDLQTSMSIHDLLQQLQTHYTQSLSYQHCSLARIQHSLQLSNNSLFNTVVNFQRVVGEDSDSGSGTINFEIIKGHDPSEYDIVVGITARENKVHAQLHYWTSHISKNQAVNVASTLKKIIVSLGQSSGQNLEQTVGDVDRLSEVSWQQISGWNANMPKAVEACVHDLIASRAKQQPNVPAVQSIYESLTYSELEKASESLACHLKAIYCVGPGVIVPFCFEKSVWAVVTMLGILKAGGAFVPLDPSHPFERRSQLVQEVQATLVISSEEHEATCEGLVHHTMVVGRSQIDALPQSYESFTNSRKVDPTNTAYVIFTSGSTGKPKGVVMAHTALCTSIIEHGRAMRVYNTTRALQFASYTFDAMICEVFTVLVHGGCVCIPTERARMDDISSVINEMDINWAFFTPSVLRLIDPSIVPGLKTIVLGGEVIGKDDVQDWADRVTLLLAYGPTECCVYCTYVESVDKDCRPDRIGFSIGSVSWVRSLVDERFLAPIGAIGELVVQGPIVAKGYLNDSYKTASSFPETPEWAKQLAIASRARFYKTGDLARYRSDGSLVYVGRKDNQVKVHGQRIELGEIETHLLSQNYLRHVMMLVPAKGSCKGKLIAVLTLEEFLDDDPTTTSIQVLEEAKWNQGRRRIQQLRSYLEDRVPSYMVPSTWIIVKDIPLLSSGKLNRGAVAQWLQDLGESEYNRIRALATDNSSLVENPGTMVEAQLRKVWSQVLNIQENLIALDRPFLSIGGDSVSSMQVVSRCRSLGILVSVQSILRWRTISQIASVATLSTEDIQQQTERLQQPFPLSPIQMLHFAFAPNGTNYYNQSFLVRVTKPIKESKLRTAIERVVEEHSMLRARFQRSQANGNAWMQMITNDVQQSYKLRKYSLDHIEDSAEEFLVAQTCLDIQHGPMLAVDLVMEPDGSQLLYLVAHHLVIDLVSWRVILQDLEDFLGDEPKPHSKPFPFQKWVELQSKYVQENYTPDSVLPFQIKSADIKPANFSFWGIEKQQNQYKDILTTEFILDDHTTEKVLETANKTLRTEPVELMIAAILLSFQKSFRDREVPTLFCEGHGRESWSPEIDLSRTVGWFTTMFPIYAEFHHNDIIDGVRQVKDVRRSIPANGWPYFTSRANDVPASGGVEPWEILFNYSGLYQQLEREGTQLQKASLGCRLPPDVDGTTVRFSIFDVSVSVDDGKMSFVFRYNSKSRHQHKIIDWALQCKSTLTEIAIALSKRTVTEATVSDFPLMRLSSQSFKTLQERVPALQNAEQIEDIYPCSPMQEGILLSRARTAGRYDVLQCYRVEVTDPLQTKTFAIDRLKTAWQKVVDRHQMLRSTFIDGVSHESAYNQVVYKRAKAGITEVHGVDETEFCSLKSVMSQFPHHLTIGTTTEGSILCKLEHSHAITDGTSAGLMIRDFQRAYMGQLSGPNPLYSDFIAFIQSRSKAAAKEFWTKYLEGITPCHFPMLNDGGTERKLQYLAVDTPSWDKISQFCNNEGITPANLFRFAWALVLQSYTGNNDVCFGYLASGRDVPIPGAQEMIGPLINMLICRMNFEGATAKPAISLLHELQSHYAESLSFQHCSLAEVQHTLSFDGSSLFNSIVNFQRILPLDRSVTPEVSFESIEDYNASEYDILLSITAAEPHLNVKLTYWTSHITPDYATNIAGSLSKTLESLVNSPSQTVGEVDRLDGVGLAQISSWNRRLPESSNICIHHLVEAQIEERPDAPAVHSSNRTFTYKQLGEISQLLAQRLQALGVGPEVVVPFCFEKSAWTVVGMLAILKAGGVCAAIDPAQPLARLESIVSDIEARVIVTQSKYVTLCSKLVNNVVTVDLELDFASDVATCEPQVRPSNAAFVAFTSGSTGKPKGAIIEHAAITTSAKHHGRATKINKHSRVLQFAAYTFDVSVQEIFTTLIHGGCICVPTEYERMNDLPNVMRSFGVNWAKLTPTVARLHLLEPEELPNLQVLVVGGEPLTQDIIDKWSEKVQLIVTYGPAECSVVSASMEVGPTEMPRVIGHATGCLLWIVDAYDHNRLAPYGSVGELLIEGPTLARKYIKNEEKTAASFIQPRWAAADSQGVPRRFYKTGDLVRYRSDGSLVYVGRKDDTQVKIHGQRIELGEIEFHLKANTPVGVQSAVETVRPSDSSDSPILVAFICPEVKRGVVSSNLQERELVLERHSLDFSVLSELDNFLSQVLPFHMLPAAYIPIQRMPLTASGKTDRAKLRKIVSIFTLAQLKSYSIKDVEKRAPTTENEISLALLWREVLKLNDQDTIGLDDNFFRLGGDSVVAIRLVALARFKGYMLSVADIFHNASLSQMVQVFYPSQGGQGSDEGSEGDEVMPFSLLQGCNIETLRNEASEQCHVTPDIISDLYPCCPLQEGLMALSSKKHGVYVAQHVRPLSHDCDIDRFKEAWSSESKSDSVLRTRIIISSSSQFFQVVIEDDLTWYYGDTLEDFLAEDLSRPMGLGSPLVRYGIVSDRQKSQRFIVVTMHHAVYDGWTLPRLLDRVECRYRKSDHQPSVPFRNFISYLANRDPTSTQRYWQSQLADAPSTTFPQLPFPKHQPVANKFMVDHAIFDRRSGSSNTLSTILRAAWTIVLAQYSNSPDVVFGATISGRNAPIAGITRISGPAITTVPVRVKVPYDHTIGDFMLQLQTQATEMIPYEHTGVQNIRRLIEGQGSPCDFQALLVVQPELGDEIVEENRVMGPNSSRRHTNFLTYALCMQCITNLNDVKFVVNYDSEVVDNDQIKRLIWQFIHVAQQICQRPEETLIKDIEVASHQDKQQLQRWNSNLPEAVEACVHDLIKARASQNPTGPAVDSYEQTFTYGRLDELSERLAGHLRTLGVGPEVIVPFCFEKSAWAIVAMLGILKAGGVFVPLDPSHPYQRRLEIVQEVHANLLLTSQTHESTCKGLTPLIMAVGQAQIDALPSLNLLSTHPSSGTASHTNTAYILFTSGSTGKPKGVVIPHVALCTSAIAHGRGMRLHQSGTRSLQFASYTFDAMICEVFTTLVHGGCVCVPSEAARMDDICGVINEMKVNWAFFTPSVLRLITPNSVPGLSTVVVGGEAVGRGDIQEWADRTVILGYGPTECCVFCTVNDFVTSEECKADVLGRSIGSVGWVVSVTNDRFLAPIGSIGELVVEGPIVAKGYLNDLTKTNTVFATQPEWASTPTRGSRFYKTGDLVRYRADGALIYVGRKDSQVKINGQRIELGEIEYHLRANLQAGVPSAVEVVQPADGSGRSLLVAFISLESDTNGPEADTTLEHHPLSQSIVSQLDSHLSEVLPLYMVPTAYLQIKNMPATVSGKTDRSKLRKIGSMLTTQQLRSYNGENSKKQAPRTESEKSLNLLWAQVLGIDLSTIGLEDNFFRLGGDSIMGIKLTTLARSVGFTLTVAEIFKHPLLWEMAQVYHPFGETESDVEPFSMLGDTDIQQLLEDTARQCSTSADIISDIYPCCPLQEGLMALSIKKPGIYLTQQIYPLSGECDVHRLYQAWRDESQQNAILRTRIVSNSLSSKLFQAVVEDKISWQTADNLSAFLARDKNVPVEFGRPLVRYCVITETDPQRRFLVVTIHHALYDGWTIPRILENVELRYREKFVEPPTPFRNFVRYLGIVDGQSTKEYWESQLLDAPPETFLPASEDRQPIADASLTHEVLIDRRLHSDITLPTILRAAWSILIARYSNSDDIVFGATLSGRNAPVSGITQILGPTITTVPIRVKIDGCQKAIDFLSSVQRHATEMIPHEQTGLQNIRRMLPTTMPLNFQTLLIIQPASEDTEPLPDRVMQNNVSNGQGNALSYALCLQCKVLLEKVELHINYDATAIEESQVRRFVFQLEHIIKQLCVEDTNSAISDIKLISPEDELELRRSTSQIPAPVEACVHNLIYNQSKQQPSAEAISSWDGSFSYAELHYVTTRLTQCLLARGITRGSVVPLLFEKSKWCIAAMIAVQKTGAAFTFLDSSYPISRLAAIAHQISPHLLLCSSLYKPLGEKLAKKADSSLNVMEICDSWYDEPHEFSSWIIPKVDYESPSYIIFTSGSTGTPKGVIVSHKALSTSITEQGRFLELGPSSRILQFTSYTFDVCFAEIFGALVHGGCLCIPSNADRFDNLIEFIEDQGVTVAFMTPSIARVIQKVRLPTIQTLVLGGEGMGRDNVEAWKGKTRLINGYGPSECCIYCVMSDVEADGCSAEIIGRSVGGQCWITDIDDPGKLSPIGCIGELTVEGSILAEGYLHDEEKTKRAFIEFPAWGKRFGVRTLNRRLYRTGDLVKYGPDGRIIFIGRKDLLVKIRGQRVELGEIEHHLNSFPAINMSLVDLPNAGRCKQQLVAIVSFSESSSQSPVSDDIELLGYEDSSLVRSKCSMIDDYLAERLPEHMIPSIYIVLTSIPLTKSGKIDRNRISSWLARMSEDMYRSVVGDEAIQEKTRPTTVTEKKLCSILSQVLSVPLDDVTLESSFTKIGGDSVSALLFAAKCRAWGLVVTVRDVLQLKTVRRMAQHAQSASATNLTHDVVAEDVADVHFDLSPVQQLFFDISPEGCNHFNQSIIVRLRKQLNQMRFEQAIDSLVQNHGMLRARFTLVEGEWKQIITNEISSSYRLRVHKNSDPEAITSVISGAERSLDITKGPILAAELFGTGSDQILFIAVHHLAIDIVSQRIILQELEDLLLFGQAPQHKSMGFQAWCQLLNRHVRDDFDAQNALGFEVLTANLEYWGVDPVRNTYGKSALKAFSLDEGKTARILESHSGIEPIDLLLGALIHSFRQIFYDRPLPAVFNEGHGREPWPEDVDLTRTIGWFTTMSPIVVPSEELDHILRTILSVKDIRSKLPGKGVKYFSNRFLSKEGHRAFAHHSPMEILFNYSGASHQRGRGDGLFSPFSSDSVVRNDIGPDVQRFALFDVSAAVSRGRLRFQFLFNEQSQHQERIMDWISCYENNLETVAGMEHRQLRNPGQQFPLVGDDAIIKEILDNKLPQIGITNPEMVDDIYPCSETQAHIMRAQKNDPAFYHVVIVWKIHSDRVRLNPKKVEQAWRAVVARHQILRTIFLDDGKSSRPNSLFQIVVEQLEPGVSILPDNSCSIKALKSKERKAFSPFSSPHQMVICRVLEGDLVCRLDISHALTDHVSVQNLTADFQHELDADDKPTSRSRPSYRQAISYFQAQDIGSLTKFWKTYLKGMTPCHIPVDMEVARERKYLCSAEAKLDEALARNFCKQNEMTLSNLFFTVWALLLHSYTGLERVGFAYLMSGRDLPVNNVQDIIGPLVNFLVICPKVRSNSQALELGGEIRDDFLDNLSYQHTEVKFLDGLGTSVKIPLVNSLINFRKHEVPDKKVRDLQLLRLHSEDPMPFDLVWEVDESSEGLSLRMTYWSNKFSEKSAKQIVEDFSFVLYAVVSNPNISIANLDLPKRFANRESST